MSNGRWHRDKLTGLPEAVDVDQGSVRSAQHLGCDTYCVRTIAAAAGYKTPGHFLKLLTDGRSLFHAVPIYDTDGRVVSWATATNSAEAGGQRARAAGNAARGYITDPSSGSLR